MTVNLKQKGIKIKPGWKLFHQCINQYEKIMKEPEEIAIDEKMVLIMKNLQKRN